METTEIAKAVAKTEAEEMLSELPEKSSSSTSSSGAAEAGSKTRANGGGSEMGEAPEMPSEMQGGPMGRGDFQGNFGEAGIVAETNEWLVPMTATGIISGTIVLAAVAICLTVWFSGKKKREA